MLIELVGPAGCGKTTVAQRIDEILAEASLPVTQFDALKELKKTAGRRDVKTLDRMARWRLLAERCRRHPRLTVSIYLLAFLAGASPGESPRKRRFRYARRALRHLHLTLDLQSQTEGKIVVVHEGFTQLLWSMLIDSQALRGEWLIRWVLRDYHAAVGQRAIRLVVDDATNKERAFSRISKGRFSRGSEARHRQTFDRWLDYHRRIVALLPSEALIAEIDASRPRDQVAGEIATMIKHLFAETRAQLGVRADANAAETRSWLQCQKC